MGNKFLSHIREVAAVAEVVRAFPDKNVTHVHGKIDPANDVGVINAELALADLETVQKRLNVVRRAARAGANKEAVLEASALEKLDKILNDGQAARAAQLTEEEQPFARQLMLLTAKPILYIVNVSEQQYQNPMQRQAALASLQLPGSPVAVPVSAKIESELAELSATDKAQFLKELGLQSSGLDDVIKAAYQVLGLITFLTTGPDETRAWTIKSGSRAPQAAGTIHTDFEKGFIKAETVFWKDLIDAGGYPRARELAKVYAEGKDYVVKDGDVMEFKFSPA